MEEAKTTLISSPEINLNIYLNESHESQVILVISLILDVYREKDLKTSAFNTEKKIIQCISNDFRDRSELSAVATKLSRSKNVVSIEQGGRFAKVRYPPYYCLKYLQLVFLSLYLSYYF